MRLVLTVSFCRSRSVITGETSPLNLRENIKVCYLQGGAGIGLLKVMFSEYFKGQISCPLL